MDPKGRTKGRMIGTLRHRVPPRLHRIRNGGRCIPPGPGAQAADRLWPAGSRKELLGRLEKRAAPLRDRHDASQRVLAACQERLQAFER